MWIVRQCANALHRAAETFPALVLTGPRQAGKTELLKREFPGSQYCTLDHPQVAREAEENPDLFLRRFTNPAIIDEVQYAPSLFRFLKIVIDKDRSAGRFFLTGSQNFPLMEGISESLSGRCAVLQIQTLSVEEIRAQFGAVDFSEMLLRGGFPEIWANRNIDQELWFSSYLSTYVERDIRNIVRVHNLRDFSRFIRAVAMRTGQLLSYSDLSRDVGVAVSTIRAWISALQVSNQIFILEPYFRNAGKRLIKSPKLYFADSGFAAFLCGIQNMDQLLNSPLRGNLWEGFVVGEIYRRYMARGIAAPIYFWRTSVGDEVDCVIEEGGRYRLIEIKFAEQVGEHDLKGFRAFERDYGAENVVDRQIVCRTPTGPVVTSDCRIATPADIALPTKRCAIEIRPT